MVNDREWLDCQKDKRRNLNTVDKKTTSYHNLLRHYLWTSQKALQSLLVHLTWSPLAAHCLKVNSLINFLINSIELHCLFSSNMIMIVTIGISNVLSDMKNCSLKIFLVVNIIEKCSQRLSPFNLFDDLNHLGQQAQVAPVGQSSQWALVRPFSAPWVCSHIFNWECHLSQKL